MRSPRAERDGFSGKRVLSHLRTKVDRSGKTLFLDDVDCFLHNCAVLP
jgi:hypothetical protein